MSEPQSEEPRLISACYTIDEEFLSGGNMTTDPLVAVHSALIRIAGDLACGRHVPREFDVDAICKTTPLAERRHTAAGIEKVIEHGKVLGIELRRLADQISAEVRRGR